MDKLIDLFDRMVANPEIGVFGALCVVQQIVIWKLVNLLFASRERNLSLVAENKKLQESQLTVFQENAKVLERNAAALSGLESAYRALAQVIQSFQTWMQAFLTGGGRG